MLSHSEDLGGVLWGLKELFSVILPTSTHHRKNNTEHSSSETEGSKKFNIANTMQMHK